MWKLTLGYSGASTWWQMLDEVETNMLEAWKMCCKHFFWIVVLQITNEVQKILNLQYLL